MSEIKILALPGSLRSNASSHLILKELIRLSPPNIMWKVYNGIGKLPHFDDGEPSAEVVEFRLQLKQADGVVICTPEYAFGVPGSLKNALDWTVSSGEFVGKPVALLTASSNGEYAHASLLLILKAISAILPPDAALHIPFVRAKIDGEGKIKDASLREDIEKVLKTLVKTIQEN